MTRLPWFSALLLGAFVTAIVGCGDGDSGPEALIIDLYEAPGAPSPYEGVAFIALTVDGTDMAAPVTNVGPYVPFGGSVTVPEIPYTGQGQTRRVTVEGWADAAGTVVVSRGRSVSIPVEPDGQKQLLPILFSRVDSFIPLTSAITLAPQQMISGRLGHTATASATGQVVIAGGGLPDSASSDARPWLAEGMAEIHTSIEVVDETVNGVGQHQFCAQECCGQDCPSGKIPVNACEPTTGCMNGLNYARAWHTATALPTGQIVFAGGWTLDNWGDPQPMSYVEVYTPGLGNKVDILQFSLNKPRAGHTATLLDPSTFEILFVGGDTDGEGTWELWDPYNGTTLSGVLPDQTVRRHHTATLFDVPGASQQAVLIAGGESDEQVLSSALIYDALQRNMVVQQTGMLKGARSQLSASFDSEVGFIYLIGGYTNIGHTTASSSIDVYDVNRLLDPTQNEFRDDTDTLVLTTPRGGHASTAMFDGSVVITGGSSATGNHLNTAEGITKYLEQQPDGSLVQNIKCVPLTQQMSRGRFGHRSVLTDRGTALLVGGLEGSTSLIMSPVYDLDSYNPK
ncbi:MAG: kelch repeat-containing protein [Myxococcota bacterium]|nr:kelch repeat-containing protein [Myxococcota bacterium]